MAPALGITAPSFTFGSRPLASVKPTLLQVVLNDDIRDSVKNKLHVLGVGGTGEVGVDLLGVLPSVQVFKLALDVSSCLFVRVGT